MIDVLLGYLGVHFNYLAAIIIMMIGLYMIISHTNLIKKVAGLNIFQTSVFLIYISMGVVTGGTAPIVAEGFSRYSNPLPQVLMLTAIVVGVATTALAFALVIRIKEEYNSLEEDEIYHLDQQDAEDEEQW